MNLTKITSFMLITLRTKDRLHVDLFVCSSGKDLLNLKVVFCRTIYVMKLNPQGLSFYMLKN